MKKRFTPIVLCCLSLSVAAAAPAKKPPVSVITDQVTTELWQPSVSVTGKLVANQGIVVTSEVAGRITKISFKSGDTVPQGAPIVQLNDQSLQAQKRMLSTDLELSKTDLRRKEDLYNKRAISKSDLDIAKARQKMEQAKIQQVDAQLKQLNITAPFPGRLGLRKVSVGDYLSPGQPIVNLQSVTPIFVDFEVPEFVFSHLKAGQRVNVKSPTYPGVTFSGNVHAYESLINPGSQSLTVRAQLSNDEAKLIPGTFVNVTLLLDTPKPVVMVPQTAVMYSAQGNYVYTVKNQTAQKVNVTLGERTQSKVIITSGLKAGEQVVTIGGMKLYDGATIIESKKKQSQPKG